MCCAVCGEARSKRHWTPTQYRARKSIVHGYNCCKECDIENVFVKASDVRRAYGELSLVLMFVQGCGSKLVPLVNIKIAGIWMLISLKMDVFDHPCAAWLRHSFKRLWSINMGFIRRRFNLVMDLPVIIRKKCSHFGVMRVLAIWGKDHPDLQQLGLNEKSLIYNNLLIYFVHSHWLKLWLKCVFLPS